MSRVSRTTPISTAVQNPTSIDISPTALTTHVAAQSTLEPPRFQRQNELSELWQSAIDDYNKQVSDVDKSFTIDTRSSQQNNKDGVEKQILDQINTFTYYRETKGPAKKICSWFADHLRVIDGMTSELASAASCTFPPAIAISTALTFFIKVAANVRADYDFMLGLLAEIGACMNLLKILRAGVPNDEAYRRSITDVLSCFLAVVGHAIRYMKRGRANRTWHAILEGRDAELNEMAERLRKCLERLSLATGLISLKSIEVVDTKLDDLTDLTIENQKTLLQGIQAIPEATFQQMPTEAIEKIWHTRKNEDKRRVLTTFGSGKEAAFIALQYQRIKKAHLWGTGVPSSRSPWFPKFAPLIEGKQRLVWLYGPSGCGRSHLAYSLSFMFKRGTRISVSIAMLSLRNEDGQSSLKAALCAAVAILAEQDETYCQSVGQDLKAQPQDPQNLELEKLWDLFYLSKFRKGSSSIAFLILDDVLDVKKEELAEFGKLLSTSLANKAQISVLFTSTAPPVDQMVSLGVTEVPIAIQDTVEDVLDLIEASLQKSSPYENLRSFSDKTKTAILTSRLPEQGMMLTSLVLQDFENSAESEIATKLTNTPGTVEAFYVRQTKRIYAVTKDPIKPIFRKILSFTTFTSRSLIPNEIAAFLDDEFWDEARVLHEIREGTLASLLEFRNDTVYYRDGNLRRYMQDHQESFSDVLIPSFEVDVLMLDKCIAALIKKRKNVSHKSDSGRQVPKSLPPKLSDRLIAYAACNIFYHFYSARNADSKEFTKYIGPYTWKNILDGLDKLTDHASDMAHNIESWGDSELPKQGWGSLLALYDDTLLWLDQGWSFGAGLKSVNALLTKPAEEPEKDEVYAQSQKLFDEKFQLLLTKLRDAHSKSCFISQGVEEQRYRFELAWTLQDCLLTKDARPRMEHSPDMVREFIHSVFPPTQGPRLHEIAAFMLFRMKHDAEGIEECDKGLDITDDSVARLKLLMLKSKCLQHPYRVHLVEYLETTNKAVKVLDEAFFKHLNETTGPLAQEAWELLGDSHAAASDFGEALKAKRQAYAIWPHNRLDKLGPLVYDLLQAQEMREIIDVFQSMTFDEQAFLLGANGYDRHEFSRYAFERAAIETGKAALVPALYRQFLESDASLDKAVISKSLGSYLFRALGNPKEAKIVLERCLSEYASQTADALTIVQVRGELMQIITEEADRRCVRRHERIEVMEHLENLAMSSTARTDSFHEGHLQLDYAHLAVIRDGVVRYQDIIDSVFWRCVDLLTDTYDDNDAAALRLLAKTLAVADTDGRFVEDSSIAFHLGFSRLPYLEDWVNDRTGSDRGSISGRSTESHSSENDMDPYGPHDASNGGLAAIDEKEESEVSLDQAAGDEAQGNEEATPRPVSENRSAEAATVEADVRDDGSSHPEDSAASEDEFFDADDGEYNGEDDEELNRSELACAGACGRRCLRWYSDDLWAMCITCGNDVALCENCYERWDEHYNQGLEWDSWREFCGENHMHIRAPLRGWKGMQNGVFSFKGREEHFHSWLSGLQRKWRAHMEGAWANPTLGNLYAPRKLVLDRKAWSNRSQATASDVDEGEEKREGEEQEQEQDGSVSPD